MDTLIAVVDFGASNTTFSVLQDMRVIYTRDFLSVASSSPKRSCAPTA